MYDCDPESREFLQLKRDEMHSKQHRDATTEASEAAFPKNDFQCIHVAPLIRVSMNQTREFGNLFLPLSATFALLHVATRTIFAGYA